VLWNHYVSEILRDAGSNPSTLVAGPILLKADYHGALVTIEDCKCKSRVGIQGICVKETKNMFEIVTPADALLKIPKEKTLFLVNARLGDEDGKEFEWRIWGDQFLVRSGERAGKKFGGKNIRGKALLEL
jgi:ribonuclease P protein subunit POP4